MPIRFDEATSTSGLRYLIIDVGGDVGIDDGRALEARVLPGQPHHAGYMLARIAKGTVYTPEVRKFFPTLQDKLAGVGVVVTSPILRAMVNIMVRLAGTSGSIARTRLFASEDEAVDFLMAVHAELARMRAAG